MSSDFEVEISGEGGGSYRVAARSPAGNIGPGAGAVADECGGLLVDPVTLIVAALVAGLSSGVTDAAGSAVKDAYQGLRGLLSRRFAGNQRAETVLEQAEDDPETFEQPLRKYVAETGADKDGAVVEAAQRLMDLLDSAGSQGGKYRIDARYVQGGQFGDHNVQTVNFGGGAASPGGR